jgi:hypothetical protein
VRKRIAPMVSGLLFVVAASAAAQSDVGSPPARSPYVDLDYPQELTLMVGQFRPKRDAAGVGPRSGPAVDVHYEWRAGGPAHIIADLGRLSSDRLVLNPLRSGAARTVGVRGQPLYTADFDLGLGLTGGKSWHHIVPELAGGVGFITDFNAQPDTGGYKFGSRFTLNYGAGVRWVPGGKWQVRADVKERLYTLAYPQAFFDTPSGGAPIVPSTQAKSFWTMNPTLSIGLSRLF